MTIPSITPFTIQAFGARIPVVDRSENLGGGGGGGGGGSDNISLVVYVLMVPLKMLS